jgi:DNA-binding NtrC family response regulator
LNVIAIDIPPLRTREGDILLLIQNFAVKFAKEFSKPVPLFSKNALQALQSYYWPGNVRELENIIQRLVLMSEGETIDAPDLPSLMRYSALKGVGPHRTIAEVEAEHILSVLASVNNNKTKAAEILGIDRKTLREKMKKTQNPSFS